MHPHYCPRSYIVTVTLAVIKFAATRFRGCACSFASNVLGWLRDFMWNWVQQEELNLLDFVMFTFRRYLEIFHHLNIHFLVLLVPRAGLPQIVSGNKSWF